MKIKNNDMTITYDGTKTKNKHSHTDNEVKMILEMMIIDLNDGTCYSINRACINQNISRQLFKYWEKDRYALDQKMSDLISRVNEAAESALVEGALQSKVNPYFAKFMLANKYGYHDKSTMDTPVNPGDNYIHTPSTLRLTVKAIPKSQNIDDPDDAEIIESE